jgi:hypothetical protein
MGTPIISDHSVFHALKCWLIATFLSGMCLLNAIVCLLVCLFRDRPAAIHIEVKSIDDTSNFDDFPDVDLRWRKSSNLFVLHLPAG